MIELFMSNVLDATRRFVNNSVDCCCKCQLIRFRMVYSECIRLRSGSHTPIWRAFELSAIEVKCMASMHFFSPPSFI